MDRLPHASHFDLCVVLPIDVLDVKLFSMILDVGFLLHIDQTKLASLV